MFLLNKGISAVTFETALTVLQRGWATIDQLRYANAWRLKHCPRIGKLALISGKLTKAQVLTVLAEQRSLETTFGQTAVALGLLDQGDVFELLQLQGKRIPLLEDALVALKVITPEQAELVSKNCATLVMADTTEDDLELVMLS
jgi:hypothetical protein